jgi:hypothetical protein
MPARTDLVRSESPRGSLLGGGLAVLSLLGPCPGPSAPAGRQGLAAGHVPGHISQPPGRGAGRPPQPLKRGLGVQVLPAHQHPLGLLNQPAVVQGGLQLLGQSPLARSSPPPCCAPGRTLAAAALMPPSPCSAGAAPIPASSGQTIRVRLNRSGDRQLNQALDTVVLTRLRTDPATRAYATRRRVQGKTNRQIKRCLVRYIARQLYRLLETQPALDPT